MACGFNRGNAQQSVSLGVAAAAGLDVKSGLTVAYVVGSPYGSAAGSGSIMALPGQIAGALAQLATPVEANAIASLRVHPLPPSGLQLRVFPLPITLALPFTPYRAARAARNRTTDPTRLPRGR